MIDMIRIRLKEDVPELGAAAGDCLYLKPSGQVVLARNVGAVALTYLPDIAHEIEKTAFDHAETQRHIAIATAAGWVHRRLPTAPTPKKKRGKPSLEVVR